jgi:hypothetical protein
MNPALDKFSRRYARRLLEREAALRKSGAWGAWEITKLNSGVPGAGGWGADVREAWKNAVFCVLVRPLSSGAHLGVSSLSGIRPSWPEMQRIKNEIVGEAKTAIEIYPPQAEVVDEANMFHLWVCAFLPAEFTIHGVDVQ